MRRWIVLFVVFFVLAFGFLYFIIPNKIALNEKNTCIANAKAFSRAIFDTTRWRQWWPAVKENETHSSTHFKYNGNDYHILEQRFSSLLLSIKKGTDSVITELLLIPLASDSVEVAWTGAAKAGTNPLNRAAKRAWMKGLSADMQTLLQRMCSFYSNPDHVYGIHIEEQKVVDSTLIYTSTTVKTHPTPNAIYNLVDKLKIFAQQHDATQTGLPMLNIMPNADSTYLIRVALPVDKKLKDEGDIHYRWMLGGGNILVTEVKGGPSQIEKAFAAMELYVADHRRIAPAIPFQSLVTDRRAQPDTAQWVTKVYWPVM